MNTEQQDTLLIQQVITDAEKFQNEPELFNQLLTQSAFIVNVAGRRVMGKEMILQVMQQAMQTHLVNIITKNEVISITFVRPDIAVVNTDKHIFVRKGDVLEEDSKACQTFMLAREQEKWLIVAIQSTIVQN